MILFLAQVVLTALALWVTTALPGVDFGDTSTPGRIGTLLVVAILLMLVNFLPKIPLMALSDRNESPVLGCLLDVVDVVIMTVTFWVTGWLAGVLGLPFHVQGLWPALWGGLIMGGFGLVFHFAFTGRL
ncbi:phage holin family protein [Actinosynnema sp. NPDC020468]|uniref:phage holin family protein n=1 Tax=Actinosynnema sp. NPDC020468 TaxID=3154488 RepID=UPI0034080930